MARRNANPGLVFTALLVALRLQGSQSAVNYILARREEAVETICLGRDSRFAFDWDPAVTYNNLPESEPGQIQFTGGGVITNANFLYIGSYANLTGHFCASQMETLLFNSELDEHFVNTQNQPLPGSAGLISYVTPIWQASNWVKVSLKVVNLVDETWQIISTQEEDPVLNPNESYSDQVQGDFFNATLESFSQVEEFLMRAATDRDAYPLATTCGAILLNEVDGTTSYIFFAVFAGDSKLCTDPGQKPNPTMRSTTCVLAHLFEAQYDVSDIDFQLINSFFSTGGYRRRLLSMQGAEKYRSYVSSRTRSPRRFLATSTGSSRSLSGGLRSVVCKVRVSKVNSRCRRGLARYPKCAMSCRAN